MNIFPLYEVALGKGRFVTLKTEPPFEVHRLNQVHGIDLIPSPSKSEGLSLADGIIFETSEIIIPVAILTADCLPVLIEGEKKSCLLHAGWRGLAQGILTQTSIQNIKPLKAIIGPHICSEHYEVQKNFLKNFSQHEFFLKKGHKITFDMYAYAAESLKKAFPKIHIGERPPCTYCNKKFHSYRRSKTTDRNWNLFIPESA